MMETQTGWIIVLAALSALVVNIVYDWLKAAIRYIKEAVHIRQYRKEVRQFNDSKNLSKWQARKRVGSRDVRN